MAIREVIIEEGCTACGLCEEICPEVFEMPDEAQVREGADFNTHEQIIIEAADSCLVEIIKYTEE